MTVFRIIVDDIIVDDEINVIVVNMFIECCNEPSILGAERTFCSIRTLGNIE